MENGLAQLEYSWFMMIYLLRMVIFDSYVSLFTGVAVADWIGPQSSVFSLIFSNSVLVAFKTWTGLIQRKIAGNHARDILRQGQFSCSSRNYTMVDNLPQFERCFLDLQTVTMFGLVQDYSKIEWFLIGFPVKEQT